MIMEVRNRFKGLDLIDRVPDDLWTEVRDMPRLIQGIRRRDGVGEDQETTA